MPLAPGSRLGPYEIGALLGSGGMGDVYRARDPRLGRDVAVKVLPDALAADADALARFEREARAVAALSHPNIVALFDIGRAHAVVFAVTELLEGETLRERLAGGPIPARKAIDWARQIADALGAAHDRGVVHRDVKPENIFITTDGRIKVLDFGVAQMSPALANDGETVAAMQTTPGTIIGTVGYMAPEQIRGQVVDGRADIFALGAVLYEMLSGRRAFSGDSAADTMTQVLQGEPPDLARAPQPVASAVAQIVHRCLEKAPAERFQSARDLSFSLQAIGSGAPPTARTPPRARARRAAALAAVAAFAILCAVGGFFLGRRAVSPVAPPSARFAIAATIAPFDAASVSPDGRSVIFTGGSNSNGANPRMSTGTLGVRHLDTLEAQVLADTEYAVPPFFWSPDSRFVGYLGNGNLVVRELSGGAVHPLVELRTRPLGATWNGKGQILYATSDGIYQVAATGGPTRLVMRTDSTHEVWRGWPSFLPDGDRFIYSTLNGYDSEARLETHVGSLDGRDLGVVIRGAIGASYADGHLFFGSAGGFFAQPFDAEHLRTTADRVEVAQNVAQDFRSGIVAGSSSETGVIVVQQQPQALSQFTWFDHEGHQLGTLGAPDTFTNFDISPDLTHVMAVRRNPVTGHNALTLIDTVRGVTSSASDLNDAEDAEDPTWAPDGEHIAYTHGSKLVMRLANGGPERTLLDGQGYSDSFTRDGRYLVFGIARGSLFEQHAIDVTTSGAKAIDLVTGLTLTDEGRFSQNGKWLAYHASQGGTEVYVMPFPPTGEKWQISRDGGAQPRWSADGQELFYLDRQGRMMAVGMRDSDPRTAAAPRLLFPLGLLVSNALDQFAVARDRFLVRMPASAGANTVTIEVLVNWRSGLAARH